MPVHGRPWRNLATSPPPGRSRSGEDEAERLPGEMRCNSVVESMMEFRLSLHRHPYHLSLAAACNTLFRNGLTFRWYRLTQTVLETGRQSECCVHPLVLFGDVHTRQISWQVSKRRPDPSGEPGKHPQPLTPHPVSHPRCRRCMSTVSVTHEPDCFMSAIAVSTVALLMPLVPSRTTYVL